MINVYHTKKKCCEDITLIENYEQAINDEKETWTCHHRREIQDGIMIWTSEELIKLGQYFNVKAEELIFLRESEHRKIHNTAFNPKTKRKVSANDSENLSKRMLGDKRNLGKPYSVFGKKFKEHFGMTKYENLKLYNRELKWFHRNGKCRWEV